MSDESKRVSAVNRFNQLDAGIKKDLDDLVNLVAEVCEVPIALISLIDDKMQWFKASVGTGDMYCNDRSLSFCQETLLGHDIMVVPDATQDERFANLPFVANEPHIRFYAGVPLVTFDGYAIGTLCISDMEVRTLSELQTKTLKVLARQVTNLMELNWSTQSVLKQNQVAEIRQQVMEDADIKLKAVFDSSKDVHILLDNDLRILAYNKAAAVYIRSHYGKEIKTGAHILFIVNETYTGKTVERLQIALRGQAVTVEWMLTYENAPNCWLAISFEPVTDGNGKVVGVTINATDITTQKLHTEQISQQNAALQKIAAIQSHELRRPVASLMGLMDLLKMDNSYAFNPYYPMMESTVLELDQKIKHIVQESELVLHRTDTETNKEALL
jgi:PAS domain S-box-containing protein